MKITNPSAPAAHRCRPDAVKRELSIRTRAFSPMISSSSPSPSPSSSSSSSTRLSSTFTLPSPVRPITSSVPFSWESKPGVPKTSPGKPNSPNPRSSLLPPPPPLRSAESDARRRLKKNAMVVDPFAVALMECSKEEEYWKMSPSSSVLETTQPKLVVDDGSSSSRRPRVLGYLLSLDLYPSCKATIASSVANSNVYIRRRYEVVHHRRPDQ